MSKVEVCKKKNKILHVCKSRIYAGAEAVAIQIINFMSDKYEIAYCCPEGPIIEKLNKESITYYSIHNLNYAELRKIIKAFSPDIIHAHDFTASILCALFSGKYKVISHIHHNSDWIKYWNVRSFLYRGGINRFSKILLVSYEIKKEAIFFKQISNQVEIIGNPIDVKKITTLANSAVDVENYDVVFIGRLVKEKDPLRFIDIINMVRKTESSIKAAIIGDGELYTECVNKIRDLGLSNNINLLGFKENPYGLLRQSRVLCVTSKWEGFGLVASEAKALATPVLLTPVGGLMELFNPNADEYCRSNEEFSEKIKMLLDNSNYESWHKRAIKNTEHVDNVREYMDRIENLYKEIVIK